jgi:hypothetical protein
VAVGDAEVPSFLTGRTCRSLRIVVFATYHSASVMILSTLDWNLSRISISRNSSTILLDAN